MNVLLLLPMACLPQDDLESYSSAWENRPAPTRPESPALGEEMPEDASAASDAAPRSDGGDGASVGGALDAGDAGLLPGDAGIEPGELDAGSAELDASTAPGADATAP